MVGQNTAFVIIRRETRMNKWVPFTARPITSPSATASPIAQIARAPHHPPIQVIWTAAAEDCRSYCIIVHHQTPSLAFDGNFSAFLNSRRGAVIFFSSNISILYSLPIRFLFQNNNAMCAYCTLGCLHERDCEGGSHFGKKRVRVLLSSLLLCLGRLLCLSVTCLGRRRGYRRGRNSSRQMFSL